MTGVWPGCSAAGCGTSARQSATRPRLTKADRQRAKVAAALHRAAPPLTGTEPAELMGGWNILTEHTTSGYVVAVVEDQPHADRFWGGPASPETRVPALRYTDPVTGRQRLYPVAVFSTPEAARAAYLKYWNWCARWGRPASAVMRVVQLEAAYEAGNRR